jgi:cytochrome c-type biogenesis protein CcmF
MSPGQSVVLGNYTIRYDRLGISDDGQKQAVTGYLTILEDGRQIDTLYPAKWIFHRRESEPTTEVAIRRALAEDLYVAMLTYDAGTQSAQFHAFVNPLVNWVWLGFGILALGTGIALLPERTFAFAVERLPAEPAASTTALLLILMLGLAAPLRAQHVEGPSTVVEQPRTPVEKSVGEKLICMCGDQGCGKALVGTCSCGFAATMRGEIAEMARQGKTEQQIIDFYLAKYNSLEPLAKPPNTGFNRMAWLFPYLLGAGGAVAIGFVAVRWSRRRDDLQSGEAPAGAADPALEDRLDDELRNLD